MEFLVILFFFGLSAGVVGRHRGSSFLIWFFVGFCVPVLGTVAAALYRRERDEPARACPECGRILPLYAQVCSSCGADLDFPEEEALGAGSSPH